MLDKAKYAFAAVAVALVLMGAGCSASSNGSVNDTQGGAGINVGGTTGGSPSKPY